MDDISALDKYYEKFSENLNALIPDGIYFVDLPLLHRFDLLHFQPSADYKDPILTQHFYVHEAQEKITLINSQFIIWITRNTAEEAPSTITLIALNYQDQEPALEAAFVAAGIYNSPSWVSKVLESFLKEIKETERILDKYDSPLA